ETGPEDQSPEEGNKHGRNRFEAVARLGLLAHDGRVQLLDVDWLLHFVLVFRRVWFVATHGCFFRLGRSPSRLSDRRNATRAFASSLGTSFLPGFVGHSHCFSRGFSSSFWRGSFAGTSSSSFHL